METGEVGFHNRNIIKYYMVKKEEEEEKIFF